MYAPISDNPVLFLFKINTMKCIIRFGLISVLLLYYHYYYSNCDVHVVDNTIIQQQKKNGNPIRITHVVAAFNIVPLPSSSSSSVSVVSTSSRYCSYYTTFQQQKPQQQQPCYGLCRTHRSKILLYASTKRTST